MRSPLSLPHRAADRRTLDERIAIRFPWVYAPLATAVALLSPRNPIRRRLMARVFSRALAAANRRDWDALLLTLHPEIEYHPPVAYLPPGFDTVYRGRAGYRAVWEQLIDGFADFRGEPVELMDLGHTLIARIDYSGHGTGSGVPITLPLSQVFRFRRGRTFWQRDYSSLDEALEEAAGPSNSP